jgi:flagellar hook protein FlgE
MEGRAWRELQGIAAFFEEYGEEKIMLRSLMSGVSGVRGHQTLLDVIGNNIANVNTTGFKKSSVTFQDLMYQTSRGSSAPGEVRGGINAIQVGLGVNVAAIETIHTQGQLQFTGNRTDMAIQGDGYFVVGDGSNQKYTRAGNFMLDAASNIVQSGTGYVLKGYQMVRDPLDPTKFTTSSSLSNIRIPVGDKMEAKPTQLVGFRCNLNSMVSPYLPMGILQNDVKINFSLGADRYSLDVETASTVANFLTITDGDGNDVVFTFIGIDEESGLPNLAPVANLAGDFRNPVYDSKTGRLTIENVAGDKKIIDLAEYMNFSKITDPANGKNYLVEFDDDLQTGNRILRVWGQTPADPPVWAVDELIVPMNNDGTFDLPNGGAIAALALDVEATENGLGLKILNVGGATVSTVNQTLSSVHNTKLDIYDSLGNPYTLEVSWEKIDNNQWRWRAWLPSDSGITLTDNTGIVNFTPDGKIEGEGTAIIGANFASIGAEDSRITLDFSGASFGKDEMEGVTQYGTAFTTKGYFQDGYSMGVLTDFASGKDGTITGVYSNGQNVPLYRIALALFANPSGLTKVGDTAFMESNNSGLAQVGPADEGGAGTIAGGTLEMGNVDLSEEFVRLIVAQRGFQANARVITTSDQVLEELINIKR